MFFRRNALSTIKRSVATTPTITRRGFNVLGDGGGGLKTSVRNTDTVQGPTAGLPDFPSIIDVEYDMPSALRVRPNTPLTQSFQAAWTEGGYEADEQFGIDLFASYAYVQYALLKCDLLKNVRGWSGQTEKGKTWKMDQGAILTWIFKSPRTQLSELTTSIEIRKTMYRNFYMLVMLKCGINLTSEKSLLAPNQVTGNSMEGLEGSWNRLQAIFLKCYKPCGVDLLPFRNLKNLNHGVTWDGTRKNLYIRYSRLFYCLVDLCLTAGQLPAQDGDGGKTINIGGGDGDDTVELGGGEEDDTVELGGGEEDDTVELDGGEISCDYTAALRDRKKARLLDLQAQLAECNARHEELDLELSLNVETKIPDEPEPKKKRNIGLALGAAATVGLGYTYYKTRGV